MYHIAQHYLPLLQQIADLQKKIGLVGTLLGASPSLSTISDEGLFSLDNTYRILWQWHLISYNR